MPVWQRRLNWLAAVPGLLPLVSAVTHLAVRYRLVHPKAEGFTRMGRDPSGLYLVRRGLFMPWELPHLLDGDLLREGLATLAPPMFLKSSAGDLPTLEYAAIALLEASFYLRNQLLRDSDWASMAHSLELRTPLVDFELLRELAPVLVQRPAGMPGKQPLALAPRPALPNDLIRRPKSGFSLPMDRWVQQSDVMTNWRANRCLCHANVHWARRMAYSLIAMTLPEVVVH